MGLENYREIIHRCFRCGYCKLTSDYSWYGFNCPMYNKYKVESYSPGGILWLAYAAFVTGEMKPSSHLAEIIYSCSMCKNCSDKCRFKFGEMVTEMLRSVREEIIENYPQLVPQIVQKFLKNVYKYGNPYGETENLDGEELFPPFQGNEYLLYLSPVALLDPVAQESARALAALLRKLNVSYGVLPEEICDGNETYFMGDKSLFQFLRDKNVEMIKKRNVEKIILLSPHSFHSFKNLYGRELEDVEIMHYTQFMHRLLTEGTLRFRNNVEIKVTYHDPCFLGRYNGIYEEPRELLKAVPGLQFVEMRRNRRDAFCCGGGGGNFYTDLIGGGEDSPARVRVREAISTGATVIAVACPICRIMLTMGVGGENVEDRIQVQDISSILLQAL